MALTVPVLTLEMAVTAATLLIDSLVTLGPPRDRDIERAKQALASAKRFGRR